MHRMHACMHAMPVKLLLVAKERGIGGCAAAIAGAIPQQHGKYMELVNQSDS